MAKLQKTIGIILLASGLVMILDATWAGWDGSSSGLGPGASLFTCWIAELQTPQIPYEQFQSLIANKENAQCRIERVDLVDTNYAGKYYAVKLKNNPIEFHIRKPENCREYPLDRLRSYGIPVGFYFSCL